ncbi:MAG: ornithine carbamoyltransferase [Chloroflexota bacterium]
MSNKAPRHFLSLTDLQPEEVQRTVERGLALKNGAVSSALSGMSAALLFEKPSLRTKLSFHVGVTRLGGHPIYFSPNEVGLGTREPVRDVAAVVSGMVSVAIIRTFAHATLEEFAAEATIPVVNALTDWEHPCQALADLLTILECRGSLQGVNVAYVGDGNNVAASLSLALASVGGNLSIASPEDYALPWEFVERVGALNDETGGTLRLVKDPHDAVRGAEFVYTDVWTSMGQEAEAARRLEDFKGYQVTPELLDEAGTGVRFMHDMPAHPGEEVSEGLLRDSRSVVFRQAANRLYAQMGLLDTLFAPGQR